MTAELLDMFTQPSMVEDWCKRMRLFIVPWVSKKGKSYWDIVRFHGHWHGELVELNRQQFAKLVINVCKDVLDDTDTEYSLIQNMQKFVHKKQLRRRTEKEKREQCPNINWRYELLPDTHACRALVEELDALFDLDIPEEKTTIIPTIKERLEDYLIKIVDEQRFAKVYSYPEYCGCTASLSVEQYAKKEFLEQRNPSVIIVYECTDEKVDESKVLQYVGRYYTDPRIKLYICSSHGFDQHTQSVAAKRNAGLMLINPQYEVTDDCYIVARSAEFYAKTQMDYEVLRGERKMTTPFEVFDDYGITYSIAEALAFRGIAVKAGLCLIAPRLTDEYIERRAIEFVNNKVNEFIREMNAFQQTHVVPSFDADPEQLLYDAGYTLEETDLSGQLAIIDFKKRKVYVDISQRKSLRRRRYSLAHELGHKVFHSELNIPLLEESEETLSMSAVASGYEQKWLEHHANYFAACLLMPKEVVGYLYSFYCQVHFGRTIVKPITLGPYPKQREDFFHIVSPIANKLNVSIDALKWRLVKLKLLRIVNNINTPQTIMWEMNLFE